MGSDRIRYTPGFIFDQMPMSGIERKKIKVLGKTMLQVKNPERRSARKKKVPVCLEKRNKKIFFQSSKDIRTFPIHAMS
jgi:hypothetical protein